jgi:hypothetical protein
MINNEVQYVIQKCGQNIPEKKKKFVETSSPLNRSKAAIILEKLELLKIHR